MSSVSRSRSSHLWMPLEMIGTYSTSTPTHMPWDTEHMLKHMDMDAAMPIM